MPDVFTKQKRSQVMSRIRSRGNKGTELALMAFFRRHKITGWRRHIKIQVTSDQWPRILPRLPQRRRGPGRGGTFLRSGPVTGHASRVTFRVRPDFVFPNLKLAVFVDGCFWHGCPRHAAWPKGNAAFWRKKLSGNRTRDRLVGRTLRKSGWHVLRIWEHALRTLRTLRWATKKQATKRPATIRNQRQATQRQRDEARLLVKFRKHRK